MPARAISALRQLIEERSPERRQISPHVGEYLRCGAIRYGFVPDRIFAAANTDMIRHQYRPSANDQERNQQNPSRGSFHASLRRRHLAWLGAGPTVFL